MMQDDWHRQPVAAALAFFVVCLILITLRPLLPIDETRYLAVAWEMWQGGSKIVPHLNGEVYSHKPPLLFWLVNLVWLVTGPSELAARLVGPAAGAAAILLTARLARTLWPEAPERAGHAAWVLATGGVFLAYGSATMFDTLMTVATLAAMLALWAMVRRPSWQAAVGLGAALAFGVLAKGPVILIHVLPAALTFPLWRPADGAARPADMFRGLGLALLVAMALLALWLVPALVFGDEGYRNDILWRQSAGRMVDSFAHQRPVWFFLALMPLFLWPWGWGREVASLWQGRGPVERFLMIWAGSAFVAFSLISGKQIHYLVPELPALALLLSRVPDAPPGRWSRLLPMLPAVIILCVGAAASLGLVTEAQLGGAKVGSLELVLATVMVGTGLALIMLAQSRKAARIVAAPVTLIAFLLIAYQTIWATNNPAGIGALFADYADKGVATVDRNYVGQFTFAARVPDPVAVLREEGELETWMEAHPGGIVLGKAPIAVEGLQLLREDGLHGDQWFAYRVDAG